MVRDRVSLTSSAKKVILDLYLQANHCEEAEDGLSENFMRMESDNVNQTVKTLTEMDWDHNWAMLGKFELCSWWKRIRRDTEHFKQDGRK